MLKNMAFQTVFGGSQLVASVVFILFVIMIHSKSFGLQNLIEQLDFVLYNDIVCLTGCHTAVSHG